MFYTYLTNPFFKRYSRERPQYKQVIVVNKSKCSVQCSRGKWHIIDAFNICCFFLVVFFFQNLPQFSPFLVPHYRQQCFFLPVYSGITCAIGEHHSIGTRKRWLHITPANNHKSMLIIATTQVRT